MDSIERHFIDQALARKREKVIKEMRQIIENEPELRTTVINAFVAWFEADWVVSSELPLIEIEDLRGEIGGYLDNLHRGLCW